LRRQLRTVVETGIAFEREESALGITCLAAPVLGAGDAPLAAISVTGPVTRFRPEAHVPAVRAAAAALGTTIARRDRLVANPTP
jgi:DNA-binding IclR family transcriptional regulator